ncbi:ABC transporter ATP-binding protein [Ferrimonas lipolytica]|uniref:ABC transporter ATP-binding protein n=1 Tax=Ferrimonas lipolytica TaxID=2724191 RepID=A0A6H1UDD2_9GAMM|nr:ABC transporter ATP-binding protein [Ferrimonas lipolytica]QIZ76600.1 ABC transporter ATP-binding protein [Ferrimonas lipolytica]
MIKLENVTFSRADGQRSRKIVDQLSHQIEQGSQIALLGDSGAGKTTLLRLIGALEPLQQGKLWVNGTELSQLDATDRALHRRKQGVVFQDCQLLSTLSVRDNILLTYRLADGHGSPPLFEPLVEQLGISSLLDRMPQQLSGGEQQRVAIARALIHQPKLVLADEPTGNLDQTNSTVVCQLLQSLARQQGATLLMVTHSQRLAQQFRQNLILANGKLTAASNSNE